VKEIVLADRHIVRIDVVKELQNNSRLSLQALHHQAVRRLIGHLAAALYHDFEFAGVGMDGKVHGAVLTLVSIEIVELQLLAHVVVGQELLHHLYLCRSGMYPFLSKETTMSILWQRRSDFSYEDLFETRTPWQGIQVLATFIAPENRSTHSFANKNCLYQQDDDDTTLELVNYLGSGTFSHVYSLSAEDSLLKIPKSRSHVWALKKERDLLLRLSDDHIPKASTKFGRLYVRCEESSLPCLKMTGVVGTCASKFCFTDHCHVKEVCRQVMLALAHAHEQDMTHLDVRPANIIVSLSRHDDDPRRVYGPANLLGSGEKSMLVQLVDWACAAGMSERLSRFRGCLPYAHDQLVLFHETIISKRTFWRPEPKHDLASLAYTMATIVLRSRDAGCSSEVPWRDISTTTRTRRGV
jgi:hypothetical protein